jgi:hypothetical protein
MESPKRSCIAHCHLSATPPAALRSADRWSAFGKILRAALVRMSASAQKSDKLGWVRVYQGSQCRDSAVGWPTGALVQANDDHPCARAFTGTIIRDGIGPNSRHRPSAICRPNNSEL